jgi:hypothetical protein
VHGQLLVEWAWQVSAPEPQFESYSFDKAAQQCLWDVAWCMPPKVADLGFHELQTFVTRTAKGSHKPTLPRVKHASIEVSGHFFP